MKIHAFGQQMGANMKKVTMQDIADEIGVSKMTISKCFQDSDDISEEMKEKIKSVAGKMGYIYNKQNRYRVLVLLSEIFLDQTDDFYTSLYKRLNEISGLNNIVLTMKVIKTVKGSIDLDFNLEFQNQNGVIILGQLPQNTVKKVISCDIPVVCLDFFYRNMQVDTITCNNFLASYYLTAYLIDKGHKKLGFVGSLNATNSINDRYLGFYKAMLESGLLLDTMIRLDDRDENGQLIELLLPESLPTAFVCNNDHIAYLLIKQLKKLGYRVPEDISVAGFDDVVYSSISEPPITTMRVARKNMAQQAIKLLLRRMKNPKAEIRAISIECNMIERESVSEYMSIDTEKFYK